jgi:hypothetical protein
MSKTIDAIRVNKDMIILSDNKIEKGQKIFCRSGHHCATLNKEVFSGDLLSCESFEWAKLQKPSLDGGILEPCSICGEFYYVNGDDDTILLIVGVD